MKGVMILLAIFSLGSLMPGKHFLIETEDSGDDSGAATKTKSKILHSRFHCYIFCTDIMENKRSPINECINWPYCSDVPAEGNKVTMITSPSC